MSSSLIFVQRYSLFFEKTRSCKIFILVVAFNTMIPITVNNIRKNLMMLGYKNLPTIQDIYKLFDKYNVRPYDVRYSKKRYHPSVMLFVQQHINELWGMQDEDEYAKIMSTLNKGKDDDESETSVSYYHPKGMSNASMELLKNDDVWYENKEAKTLTYSHD